MLPFQPADSQSLCSEEVVKGCYKEKKKALRGEALIKKSELTVSLWSVLEAEGQRQRGVLLEKLCGEGVPPQAVALL